MSLPLKADHSSQGESRGRFWFSGLHTIPLILLACNLHVTYRVFIFSPLDGRWLLSRERLFIFVSLVPDGVSSMLLALKAKVKWMKPKKTIYSSNYQHLTYSKKPSLIFSPAAFSWHLTGDIGEVALINFQEENRNTFQNKTVQYSELLNSMNFKDKSVLIIRRQVLSTFVWIWFLGFLICLQSHLHPPLLPNLSSM